MRPMGDRRDQWWFVWKMFGSGLLFYLATTLWIDVMPPEVYGAMAHNIQSSIWSLGFMSSSGMVIYGISINGRWRWSPLLRIVGYVMLLMMFSFLAVSSLFSQYGAVVLIFSVVYFIPTIASFIKVNIDDLTARWGDESR